LIGFKKVANKKLPSAARGREFSFCPFFSYIVADILSGILLPHCRRDGGLESKHHQFCGKNHQIEGFSEFPVDNPGRGRYPPLSTRGA
jgi:hypothetical protein